MIPKLLGFQNVGMRLLRTPTNWPRCIQIAWQLHDIWANVEHQDFLVRPEGFNIPYDAEQIHGISTALATAQGEVSGCSRKI